jgi:hypothetical protein
LHSSLTPAFITSIFNQSIHQKEKIIMPKISEMIPSNYLKQSDFDSSGAIVTVKGLEQKNVAQDDQEPDVKWVIYFREFAKPLVLNTTNINAMAEACDSDHSDDWIGQEVVVYVDPNINFGGKRVGGLRVRKYQTAAPVAPPVRVGLPPAVGSGFGAALAAEGTGAVFANSSGLPASAPLPTALPPAATTVATAPLGARSPAKTRR